MAAVTFLLSLLTRKLNDIIQAVFGWSVTALFGKLRRRAQVLVTAALVLSVLWPVFVLGVLAPGVSSWALAMVPLHHWFDDNALRLMWLALAVLTPLGVGAVVHLVVRKGRLPGDMLRGYQLALGFSAAFVVVVITVPLVKIASLVRRWSDEHVYVEAREHAYDDVLRCLVDACRLAGLEPTISDAPRSMVLATTIMRAIAGSAVTPFVTEKLRRITADGLELYVYPGDLLVRGEPYKAARVRAMIAHTQIESFAYLVDSDDAKSIQDALAHLSRAIDNPTSPLHTSSLVAQLQALYQRVIQANVTFEQWSVLEGLARKLERRMVIGYMTRPAELPLDTVIETMRSHPAVTRAIHARYAQPRIALASYAGARSPTKGTS
jgi:hypothetical protein